VILFLQEDEETREIIYMLGQLFETVSLRYDCILSRSPTAIRTSHSDGMPNYQWTYRFPMFYGFVNYKIPWEI